MPAVPTYDNLRTSVTPEPNATYSAPSGPGPQEIAGRQLQETGQALSGAGQAAQRIAMAMQDQVDQVRVNDAVNQARRAAQDLAYNPQTGYLNLKGDAALTRPDGRALPQEYGDKLGEHISTIAQSLGTERQRQQFMANAQALSTQFAGQVESHMLGEFRSHAISVQDGTIALASDDAKRNWNNPDVIAPALGAAKAAVVERGNMMGWSAAQIDAALLATTGKVHSDVIMSALENGNPTYAATYLDAHRKEMTADDILRVQGHVNKEVWQGMAQSAVQAAGQEAAPLLAPDNFDRMVHITAQTESGGREVDANGRTITSPKGAQGIMQVMPATAKNPGFGIKPAADNSPAERERVGREYLQAMLQQYGDPAKAWAAYNAGPARVDQEIRDAAKRGDPNAWLSNLPKETQAYVAKNMAALGQGDAPAKPTELAFVQSALAKLPPGSPPQVVALTQAQATRQWGLLNKSVADTADAAVAQIQRYIAANPGTTLDKVPAQYLDAVRQYAPGKLDDLTKYANTLNGGEKIKSDLVLYNRLASHPEEMVRMTDAQFEGLRAHLSEPDFKHFAQERGTAQTVGVEALNKGAMTDALNSRLQGLGISPTPKASDAKAQERLGGIKQFVRNSLFEEQAARGRKLTPEEIETHIDKLFTKSIDFRNSLWGTTSTETLMAMQLSDLPSGAKDGLRQALVNSGTRNPTDTDILNLYRKLHTRGTN